MIGVTLRYKWITKKYTFYLGDLHGPGLEPIKGAILPRSLPLGGWCANRGRHNPFRILLEGS